MPSSFEIVGMSPTNDSTDRARRPTRRRISRSRSSRSTTTGCSSGRRADAKSFVPTLRQIVWSMDRDLPLENVRTMDEILGDSVADSRFNTALLSLFAVVALLLAAIGIYGVLAFTVAQRTSEIGIRMALGAQRSSVLRLVVGNGLTLALIGVAIGAAVALVATRALEQAGVRGQYDGSGGIRVCGAGADSRGGYGGGGAGARASRVDPIVALRSE